MSLTTVANKFQSETGIAKTNTKNNFQLRIVSRRGRCRMNSNDTHRPQSETMLDRNLLKRKRLLPHEGITYN